MTTVTVQLEDRIQVPSERKLTDAGQMHVPCKFARTGSQLYTAKQLGLVDREPNEVVAVLRDESEVFAEESMDSFRSAPVTIGHPVNDEGKSIAVSAENSSELQVGMLEGMPVRDEDTLGGVLVLTAQAAIDALEEGTQELSAGYTCDIVQDEDGQLFQRNIRANHIAIVAKGRAGSSCRISDEAELQLEDAYLASQAKVASLTDEAAVAAAELEEVKAEIATLTDAAEEAAEVLAQAKVDLEVSEAALADAKVAAEEGVVARTNAIEHARLISDIRVEDITASSVSEIERMVVADQLPEKDISEKSDEFVSAMFEMLVDAAKGETPMGKLLAKEALADDTIVTKKVDKVAEARNKSIARSKEAAK